MLKTPTLTTVNGKNSKPRTLMVIVEALSVCAASAIFTDAMLCC